MNSQEPTPPRFMRLPSPLPGVAAGAAACAACGGSGVERDSALFPVESADVVLVLEVICSVCHGCAAAECGCAYTDDGVPIETGSGYSGLGQPGGPRPAGACGSCGGIGWYRMQVAFSPESTRVEELVMPCGCTEQRMVPVTGAEAQTLARRL